MIETELEIDRTYPVPCVRTSWPLRRSGPLKHARIRWVPVIGPVHSDRDVVDYPDLHWHADVRFLDLRELWEDPLVDIRFRYGPGLAAEAILMPIPEVCPEPLLGEDEQPVPLNELSGGDVDPGRFYRVMELPYRRPYPPDPMRGSEYLQQLTREYADRTLVRGTMCPHRSADLSGIEPDADGVVTCPLHGLRWHMGTGRIMPPLPELPHALNMVPAC